MATEATACRWGLFDSAWSNRWLLPCERTATKGGYRPGERSHPVFFTPGPAVRSYINGIPFTGASTSQNGMKHRECTLYIFSRCAYALKNIIVANLLEPLRHPYLWYEGRLAHPKQVAPPPEQTQDHLAGTDRTAARPGRNTGCRIESPRAGINDNHLPNLLALITIRLLGMLFQAGGHCTAHV